MYWGDTKHPGITFQCKQCKKGYTEKSFLSAHIQVLHEKISVDLQQIQILEEN